MRCGSAFPVDGGTEHSTCALAIAWRAVCAPVHAVLALLEPMVSFLLGLLALMGIAMSLVFQLLRPQFPFWTMMFISLSFLIALGVYHLALRVTAGR